jgi:hypothetical protein
MRRRAMILYGVPTIKMLRRWLYVRERRKLLHTSITKNNGDSEPLLVALIVEYEYIYSTVEKRRQTAVSPRFWLSYKILCDTHDFFASSAFYFVFISKIEDARDSCSGASFTNRLQEPDVASSRLSKISKELVEWDKCAVHINQHVEKICGLIYESPDMSKIIFYKMYGRAKDHQSSWYVFGQSDR